MGGFIYQPEEDSEDKAECLYCNLGLDGFESNDIPFKEHEKRSETCFFFKNRVVTEAKKSIQYDGTYGGLCGVVDKKPKTIPKRVTFLKTQTFSPMIHK